MKGQDFETFNSAIASPSTRSEYTRKLNNYAKFYKITDWDKYVKKAILEFKSFKYVILEHFIWVFY